MRRRKYGRVTYLIAALIIIVHLANIVAKFMGKDVGIGIPESLKAIQDQAEIATICYFVINHQRQLNGTNKRINEMKQDLPYSPNPSILP